MMSENNKFSDKIDASAILTAIGIVLLFSTAIAAVLITPLYVDPSWVQPTTSYQVQLYEISDPNIYISSATTKERQQVYHLKNDYTLLAFQEREHLRIVAPPDLEKYITRNQDEQLKLTSKLLMLREPKETAEFNALQIANTWKAELQTKWEKENQIAIAEDVSPPTYEVLELYDPMTAEAFAIAPPTGVLENWVESNFTLLDEKKQPYHHDSGVIYISNPMEYRISFYQREGEEGWKFDPNGKRISSLEELKSHSLRFLSREELISMGEKIYAVEGCWYCHTDQTRTLIQDTVLNGSDSYPAPPSSANEYIYQKITFPGTRRIGPDLSRVGVKRPSRDWHMSHFWSPKTASVGSIMPSFHHFFDNDPRGTSLNRMGIPNYQFEAIFQYLMTKGTRITPPTESWWLGKDPIRTKEVIEGLRKLP